MTAAGDILAIKTWHATDVSLRETEWIPPVVSADFRHRAAGGGWTTYYTANMGRNVVQNGNAWCPQDTLFGIPFVVPSGGVIDDIRMFVIGAGGGTCRVGVYEATSSTNLYPNNLISDCGTFAVNAGGIKTIGGLSVAVEAGKLYWFAFNQSAGWTSYGFNPNDANITLGYDNSGVNPGYHSCSVALAYAAMPATFTGGATLLGPGGQNLQAIWYHLSA